MANKKFSGFTLVELLIVIIIIGILATMAVPQYNKMVEKSKWTEAMSMLGALKNAVEIYYAEHGIYPYRIGPHIRLNGSQKETDHGLLIEVPDYPSQTRYLYIIMDGKWFQPGEEPQKKFGVSAFIDTKINDGIHNAEEPILDVYGNGEHQSEYGAPEF